jgi:hypothetical protein
MIGTSAIAEDKENNQGATEAGISTNASFGSNFLGDFPVDAVMQFLEKEHELWDAAGIKVTAVSVGDPMGWCHPMKVEEIFGRERVEQGLPPFEVDGDWPWNEAFFPKPSAITSQDGQ